MELPGYLSQSRMARSHDSFICMFLRNLCTDFHNGFINLYPNQQWVGVLFSPYPPQHFLLVFLMTAILTRVRDYLKVVLICMSPLTKDVDHFPKRFLESVSSFENCLLISSVHLPTGSFASLAFNSCSSLSVLDTSFCLSLVRILSHLVGSLRALMLVLFWCAEPF